MKLDSSLTQCIKMNSRCIIPINIKPETIKLLNENKENIFMALGETKIS
jgi:hypothetical protein